MHFTAILVGLTAIASAVEIRPLGQLNDIVNFSKTVVLQHPDDLNQLANLTKSKQMHQVRFQWCSNSWDDTSCGMRELTHKVCCKSLTSPFFLQASVPGACTLTCVDDLDVMDKTLAFRPMRLISIANGACVLYK